MKKQSLLISLILSLCLLAGCAGSSATSAKPDTSPESDSPATSQMGSSALVEEALPLFMTLRIISGAETGDLMLAEAGEAGSGIYTLNIQAFPKNTLPEEPLRNGQLINVYYGAFTEAWPMRFGGVTAVEVVNSGFDNRATLYLRVLEDLWSKDSGLNEGVEIIGVDLSQTSLIPAEQSAVAWVFAESHGAALAEGSLEELIDQGYISAEPIGVTDSGILLSSEKAHYFYEWKNGIHFSITEQPMEGTYSLTPVTFDAQKWRSSLGAYFFSNCTAVQSALGEWSDYAIGSEMIS